MVDAPTMPQKTLGQACFLEGKAKQLVKQYDHVKPSDLKRWLSYTGMSEDEFDRISDTFRDREYGNEKMASGLRTMFGTNQSPDRLSLIFIRKSSGV